MYNFVKLSVAMKNRSQAPYRWANRSLLKPARDSNPESPDICCFEETHSNTCSAATAGIAHKSTKTTV